VICRDCGADGIKDTWAHNKECPGPVVAALREDAIVRMGGTRAEIARLRARLVEVEGALTRACVALGGCITEPPCGGCVYCDARAVLSRTEGREPGAYPRPEEVKP
jgi:hypothetical protein